MTVITPMHIRDSVLFGLGLIFLAITSYARIWTIHGVMWDDNAWLMSLYSTDDLHGFLNTGFVEMRRIPQGIFLYVLFWLHRNTDLYYMVWHTLNMVTQIGTPLLLFAFCLRTFDNQRLLAFLIAASLIAIPLDQTLPHASSINYRLGLLLAITSFHLTVLAIQGNKSIWLLSASVGIAVLAYTVFMEATVALEPGRIVVIAYLLNRRYGMRGRYLARESLMKWLPFLLACTPFAAYRLLARSYGAYADIYQADFLFWLNWQDNINLLAMLLLIQWVIFLDYVGEASAWTFAASALSITGLFIIFQLVLDKKSVFSISERKKTSLRTGPRFAAFLGVILLVPGLLLFQFFGRTVTWGLYSSHGAIGQFGYALVLGSLLFLILRKLADKSLRLAMYGSIGVVMLFAAGTFFNNLNLDLYRSVHRQINDFWTVFIQRFPSLPHETTFLIDVRLDTFYAPRYHVAFEFPLNLLYATEKQPEEFRRHRVLMLDEAEGVIRNIKSISQVYETRIVRPTSWGTDTLEPAKFIVIYYDKSGMLVNKEIIEKFPTTPYRVMLDKNIPSLLNEEIRYPLRYKMLIRS